MKGRFLNLACFNVISLIDLSHSRTVCSFLKKNKIDLCIFCEPNISAAVDVITDRSNVYCNMFGPHIHNHRGLYITNPLIHLL